MSWTKFFLNLALREREAAPTQHGVSTLNRNFWGKITTIWYYNMVGISFLLRKPWIILKSTVLPLTPNPYFSNP